MACIRLAVAWIARVAKKHSAPNLDVGSRRSAQEIKKNAKNTKVTAIIRASFWHTTLRQTPKKFVVQNAFQNHVRSCHDLRSQHAVARTAALAGGMVVALGRVLVRFSSRVHSRS